jgi:hypothetical protein
MNRHEHCFPYRHEENGMTKRLVTPNTQPLEGAERLAWDFFWLMTVVLALAGLALALWA